MSAFLLVRFPSALRTGVRVSAHPALHVIAPIGLGAGWGCVLVHGVGIRMPRWAMLTAIWLHKEGCRWRP